MSRSAIFVLPLAVLAHAGCSNEATTSSGAANGADAGTGGSVVDAGSASNDSAIAAQAGDSGTGGSRPVGSSDDSGSTSSDAAGDSASVGSPDDGFANAPNCPAQHPTLLDGYAYKPTWRVAGVDYCVGYPSATTLKDPATISMAGVTIDTNTNLITVTANDVTLDGYDFSLGGAWGVVVEAANATIRNSKFIAGANGNTPVIGMSQATNLYVGYNVIDGNDQDTGPWGGEISTLGDGFTIEYNWIKNSGNDVIQQVSGGNDVVIRYNLIEQGGMLQGTHGDYTQLQGGPFTVSILYNTTTQNGGTTQGLMTTTSSSGDLGNNTMIGTVSYFTSVDITSIVTTFTVHDNYFDPQGYGFCYPNSGPDDSSAKSIFTHNVNMVTGEVISDSQMTGPDM